jgi:hypothetical protein
MKVRVQRAMRWLVCAMLCACHRTPPSVELTAPAPSASASQATAHVAAPKAEAAPIQSKAVGAWARGFPRDEGFVTLEVGDAPSALLTWRIGAYHAVKALAADADYAANHVAAVSLVVRARDNEVVVPLGELSGSAPPLGQSYCKNGGFHLAGGDVWAFPNDPSVAAAFSVGVAQGSSDFLVVRDGATLHLLHRETTDGRCDELKQGPLDTCKYAEYKRRANIHIAEAAVLSETIDGPGSVNADSGASGGFDCAASVAGAHVLTR